MFSHVFCLAAPLTSYHIGKAFGFETYIIGINYVDISGPAGVDLH